MIDIALRFITWPDRLLGIAVGSFDAKDEQGILDAFVPYLESLFPDRDLDDIRRAAEGFLGAHRDLGRWYGALLKERALRVDIFDREPRIPLRSFPAWTVLTRQIDPDALVTLKVAQLGQADQVGELTRWGTYPVCGDRELEGRGLGRALADIHVHLAGCDPLPVFWQRLMMTEGGAGEQGLWPLRLESLPRYSAKELRRLFGRGGESHGYEERIREVEAMGEIRDTIRPKLLAVTSIPDDRCSSKANQSVVPEEMLEERRMLADAWSRSITMEARGSEDAESLDTYLFWKNRFLSNHLMRPGTHPGLRNFRRYLDGAEESSGKSPRIRKLEVLRRMRFVAESPRLRRLEIRISPKSTVPEYAAFFKQWKEVSGKVKDFRRSLARPEIFGGNTEKLDIRFVIHFIRPGHRDDPFDGEIRFNGLRRRLARQSAVLQLFRRRCPDLASFIVGLDVANLERDCSPEAFTPYFRLLRGSKLEDVSFGRGWGVESPIWALPWWRLKKRNLASPSVAQPRLGASFHAGEDFYHPLQGMRHIDMAARGCWMKEGDRIGHGMALGLDPGDFYRGERIGGMIPRGTLVDDLIWLFGRLSSSERRFPRVLRDCEEMVGKYSFELYGRRFPIQVLSMGLEERLKMPPTRSGIAGDQLGDLLEADLFDQECRWRRRGMVRFPRRLADCVEALQAVQEDLARELADKRIVVEVNPSSNWVLGRLGNLRDHPMHRLLKVLGDEARLTINTDDPALFATRIENEYALVLDAMIGNGRDDCSALADLERMRLTGLETSFGGSFE